MSTAYDFLTSLHLSKAIEEVLPLMKHAESRIKKPRKTYTVTKPRERWSEEEHEKFLEGLRLHKRDWKKVQQHVGSKDIMQVRSHAQKYFLKQHKHKRVGQEIFSIGNGVVLPEKLIQVLDAYRSSLSVQSESDQHCKAASRHDVPESSSADSPRSPSADEYCSSSSERPVRFDDFLERYRRSKCSLSYICSGSQQGDGNLSDASSTMSSPSPRSQSSKSSSSVECALSALLEIGKAPRSSVPDSEHCSENTHLPQESQEMSSNRAVSVGGDTVLESGLEHRINKDSLEVSTEDIEPRVLLECTQQLFETVDVLCAKLATGHAALGRKRPAHEVATLEQVSLICSDAMKRLNHVLKQPRV
mmetsp:Transcript_14503/g.24739  ORF Transcript_14503/g.24739 Transcript_14503/m.24739 type:complete len:360 (-) Transcript_14503:587-1666(-)